ncbi:hypothetical protein A1F94_001394 [Pyrenophora tritici-repentis]|nr:hypothetical protein PtrV1_02011 [Pyrenophora tritici-repentis]KAF7454746.1 hypothetical protein A1F99_020040 [Pyrenophora tritici-repentis]KAF7577878.1 hypothetical protein PtrM4_021180 [Pyrenophora tritici-repentis]KAG9388502.1 hypothetical protein A1F94_001394 [Pyrenophora tritici-repentis]KAI1513809.1 hypothetical protein Ptr86124_007711 [Pyrenophora tritici-repentis]
MDYNPKIWVRADGKEWSVRFGTRMFDNKTGEYVEFCHPDPALLADVNPNDEEWRRKYNDFFHKLGGEWSEDDAEDEKDNGKKGMYVVEGDVEGEDMEEDDVEGQDVEMDGGAET